MRPIREGAPWHIKPKIFWMMLKAKSDGQTDWLSVIIWFTLWLPSRTHFTLKIEANNVLRNVGILVQHKGEWSEFRCSFFCCEVILLHTVSFFWITAWSKHSLPFYEDEQLVFPQCTVFLCLWIPTSSHPYLQKLSFPHVSVSMHII